MGIDTTEAARHLASLRPKRQHICPVCGKTFEGTGRRTYCSTNCKVKAFYRRQQGKSIADNQAQPAEEGEPASKGNEGQE